MSQIGSDGKAQMECSDEMLRRNAQMKCSEGMLILVDLWWSVTAIRRQNVCNGRNIRTHSICRVTRSFVTRCYLTLRKMISAATSRSGRGASEM